MQMPDTNDTDVQKYMEFRVKVEVYSATYGQNIHVPHPMRAILFIHIMILCYGQLRGNSFKVIIFHIEICMSKTTEWLLFSISSLFCVFRYISLF